jgi:hypothetical protein
VSALVDLDNVERHLAGALEKATDQKGENLLRREGGGVALLPEASRVIAQMIAVGLLRDTAKVLGDVRSAYNPAPDVPEPDWERVSHAVAYSALRLAGQAVHASFRADRASRIEGA